MSETLKSEPMVRVLHRVTAETRSSVVTVDEGLFSADFLRSFLGDVAYAQAIADGDLVVIQHESEESA